MVSLPNLKLSPADCFQISIGMRCWLLLAHLHYNGETLTSTCSFSETETETETVDRKAEIVDVKSSAFTEVLDKTTDLFEKGASSSLSSCISSDLVLTRHCAHLITVDESSTIICTLKRIHIFYMKNAMPEPGFNHSNLKRKKI